MRQKYKIRSEVAFNGHIARKIHSVLHNCFGGFAVKVIFSFKSQGFDKMTLFPLGTSCKEDQSCQYIDLFTTRHKVVHNGGYPNFKGLLFDKKTTYMAQILQSLNYKVYSIILPKFNTFGLCIPILSTSAIMDQIACCCNVTTSETGLLIQNLWLRIIPCDHYNHKETKKYVL